MALVSMAKRNVAKLTQVLCTRVNLLLTGLEKMLQKTWSSRSLLKRPVFMRNPIPVGASIWEEWTVMLELRSPLSMASQQSARKRILRPVCRSWSTT